MILSIILLIKNRKKIDWTLYVITTIFFSVFAWLEFQFCNTFDPVTSCWQFSKSAILGYYILSIPIEDIVFAPVCATMFYIIWIFTISKKRYENIETKLNTKIASIIMLIISVLIGQYFFCFGGDFGKYQNIRYVIGFIALLWCYNNIYKTRFIILLFSIFLFAFLWDIFALNSFQWVYKDYFIGRVSKIWNLDNSQWFLIGKGWFSTCTFFYYFSGAVFFLGIIEATNKYLYNYRKKKRLA
jgi:membrane-associated HD superfamily phosphohydrolase